jgi:hypothetical protein
MVFDGQKDHLGVSRQIEQKVLVEDEFSEVVSRL